MILIRVVQLKRFQLIYLQARRQDLAVGGPKTKKRGQKPEGGPIFSNTVLDVCSNRGAKREMGGTDFKWGDRAPLPPPWRRPCLPDIIILGCSVTVTNGAKIYIRFVVCGATAG